VAKLDNGKRERDDNDNCTPTAHETKINRYEGMNDITRSFKAVKFINSAGLNISRKDFQSALNEFNEAILVYPRKSFSVPWAVCCNELDDKPQDRLQSMLKEVTTCLTNDPDNYMARVMRAQIHLMKGELVQASTDLEYVLKADDQFAYALALLGIVRQLQGQLIEAEEFLEKAIYPNFEDEDFTNVITAYQPLYNVSFQDMNPGAQKYWLLAHGDIKCKNGDKKEANDELLEKEILTETGTSENLLYFFSHSPSKTLHLELTGKQIYYQYQGKPYPDDFNRQLDNEVEEYIKIADYPTLCKLQDIVQSDKANVTEATKDKINRRLHELTASQASSSSDATSSSSSADNRYRLRAVPNSPTSEPASPSTDQEHVVPQITISSPH